MGSQLPEPSGDLPVAEWPVNLRRFIASERRLIVLAVLALLQPVGLYVLFVHVQKSELQIDGIVLLLLAAPVLAFMLFVQVFDVSRRSRTQMPFKLRWIAAWILWLAYALYSLGGLLAFAG